MHLGEELALGGQRPGRVVDAQAPGDPPLQGGDGLFKAHKGFAMQPGFLLALVQIASRDIHLAGVTQVQRHVQRAQRPEIGRAAGKVQMDPA